MDSDPDRSRPALSVVIPTYHDAHCLDLTLRGLVRQTLLTDLFEVVVVRDGDGPGYESIETAGKPLDLRVVTLPERRGRGPARNVGLALARGPVVLFLDADSYPAPDLLERHHRAHRAAGRRVLLGLRHEISWPHVGHLIRDEPVPDVLLAAAECQDLRFPDPDDEAAVRELLQTPWLFAYTHNISAPHELLVAAGGFNEEFGTRWGWEDLELFYRVYGVLGRDESAFALDRGAVCYHLPNYRDAAAWYDDYLANEALVRRAYQHLDWEFVGRWTPDGAAQRIRRYRQVIADCLAARACRVAPVRHWVAGQLSALVPGGAGRIVWVGTGTEELAPGEAALTLDHGRPPSATNLHLIGTVIPAAAGAFDAVVSVDFWRYLSWTDLCPMLAESLRVAATVLLVCTDTPLAGRPAPNRAELDYLAAALGRHFEAVVVADSASWPVALRLTAWAGATAGAR
jgi:glycosyltransferase involved in cell wall biosynthesis